MAKQEIAVNTSLLTGDIVELRDALNRARILLDRMFQQIRELDVMWDGPSNEEFNRQFANDYDNASGLCRMADSLIECMEYARDRYNLGENQVNSIIERIRI